MLNPAFDPSAPRRVRILSTGAARPCMKVSGGAERVSVPLGTREAFAALFGGYPGYVVEEVTARRMTLRRT